MTVLPQKASLDVVPSAGWNAILDKIQNGTDLDVLLGQIAGDVRIVVPGSGSGTEADPYPGADIQTVFDAIPAAGRAAVILPPGYWGVGTTLTLTKNSVAFLGFSHPDAGGDHGQSEGAVTLKWTGAPAGIMLQLGDLASEIHGLHLSGLLFDCDQLAKHAILGENLLYCLLENLGVRDTQPAQLGIFMRADETDIHGTTFREINFSNPAGVGFPHGLALNDNLAAKQVTSCHISHIEAIGGWRAPVRIANRVNRCYFDHIASAGGTDDVVDFVGTGNANNYDNVFTNMRSDGGQEFKPAQTQRLRATGLSNLITLTIGAGVTEYFVEYLDGRIFSDLQTRGTAVIANGTPSIVVPHGLFAVPALALASGRDLETDQLRVSARDATNITLAVPANVTADRTVDWYVEV